MDNIQLTLESSTTSLSLNSDGIYLNPEIDGLAGLPEIRTTSGVNAGYNGGWTSAQFYDARLITIRGVISDSDISVVEDRRKALVGLLGQGRKEELTLHFVTAGGNSYVLNCRTISCEMALSGLARKQEFLIQLRADDPLIYDDGALATEAIVNVRRALGGFQIDFGLPLYIGGGVNETLVENGNETVYPVINLYGPLHSPTIINQTTNQQMQVLTDLDYTLTWVNPVEVTGDYILVTNETDKESPLSSVELLGNTTQDTLSGKNLLGFPNKAEYTSNGLTISVVDGLITINGTASALTFFDATTLFNFGTTTTNLTLNIIRVSGTWSAGVMGISSRDSSDTQIQYHQMAYNQSGLSATKEYTATTLGNIANIKFYINKDSVLSNYKFYVQVVKGSTADSNYEPYCGGMPAPNPTYPIAVQTTTGEQVVEICGKNLVDSGSMYIHAGAGLTITHEADGSITLNGTLTGSAYNIRVDATDILKNLVGETITLSVATSGTGNWRNFGVKKAAGGDLLVVSKAQGNTKTGTFASNAGGYIFDLYGNSADGTTFSNFNVKLQCELGSTASDFEPYQSQSYEVNLGKNLFDGETVNGWLNSSGVLQTSTSDRTSTNYIAVQPNTTYTLHGTNSTYLKFTQFNGSKTAVSQQTTTSATTLTTTTGASTAYVRIGWGNASSASNIQLEIGSSATDYAPYFTPIELCKLGDYQDKIYKSGDDWFVHKEVGKYVLTSDVAITPQINTSLANTTRFQFTNILNEPSSTVGRTSLKCSHFEYKSNWGADVVGIQLPDYADESQNTRFWFRVLKTTATTFDELKTFLTDNPISLYYALATATDTQITNQALIDQLDALASSTLFVGVNNIALVPSGGAQGELSIDYFSAYTEDRDIVVIDSQARTITKNGADIYYLKADGSEFPTLAPGENTLYLTSEQTSDEGYAEIKFKQGYLSI